MKASYPETFVPFLDGGLVVARVRLEKLQIFFGQFRLATETGAHFSSASVSVLRCIVTWFLFFCSSRDQSGRFACARVCRTTTTID